MNNHIGYIFINILMGIEFKMFWLPLVAELLCKVRLVWGKPACLIYFNFKKRFDDIGINLKDEI